MKKNLLAILALLFVIPSYIFAQVTPACAPPGVVVPAENCQTACISCGFSTYAGTTAGWAGDPQPPGWCSNIQNDQWIGFSASTTTATITITPGNCIQGQGLQAAIYPANCNEDPIACNAGCATCGTTPIILNATTLVPGQNYFLVIDGYSQDQCDFTVSVSPTQNGLVVGPTTQIAGPAMICAGNTLSYNIGQVTGAGYYRWESNNPNVLFNGQPGPVDLAGPSGNQVNITAPAGLPAGQLLQVCVTPFNSCNTGAQRCKTLTIGALPTVTYPSVTICNEDLPYTLPWGGTVSTSGVYTTSIPATTGCDTLFQQTVTVLPPVVTTLVQYICQGASVQICGNTYTANGNYTNVCTTVTGCDSTINLSLNVLAPLADIIDPDTLLSCNLQQLVLHSKPSPNTPVATVKTWRDLANGATATGDTLVVSHAGWYQLCAVMAGGGISCQQCDTIYVGVDSTIAPPSPVVTVSGPITCASPTTTLTGSTLFPAMGFHWEGPGGFSADTSIVSIAVPGLYTFSAAGQNCSTSLTVNVPEDKNTGVSGLTSSNIICATPGAVSATTTQPGITFLWTTPTGDQVTTQTVASTVPGQYSLVATNPANGCTYSGAIDLQKDTIVYVTNITQYICSGESVQVCGVSYSNSGNYSSTCAGPWGCDSIVNLTLVVLHPVAEISSPGTLLSCNNPEVVLTSAVSANGSINTWTDLSNGQTASGDSLIVTHAGWYQLCSAISGGGIICTACDTIYVGVDSAQLTPITSATISGPITCVGPAVLTGSTVFPANTYSWIGPNGFSSSSLSIEVTVPGVYIFEAAIQNCSSQVSVTVIEDKDAGVTGVVSQPVTCSGPGSATVETTASGLLYQWVTPEGANPALQNIPCYAPGTYFVTVTNPSNGCTYTGQTEVGVDQVIPTVIFTITNSVNGQNTGAIDLTPITGTPPFTYLWLISGAVVDTTEDLTNLGAGIYKVIVTDSKGCTTSVTMIVTNVMSGTHEISAAGLWQASPNPASVSIAVQWKGSITPPAARLSCFDVAGRLVYQSNMAAGQVLQQIDCAAFPSGTYLLEIAPLDGTPKSSVRVEVVR